MVLNWIFDSDDFGVGRIDLVEQGVERGGFTRAGGAG